MTKSSLLTVAEAAAELRMSSQTVRRLIAAGKLRASRPGKDFRIRRVDLDALTGTYVESRPVTSSTAGGAR